jgi:hypothetical protein
MKALSSGETMPSTDTNAHKPSSGSGSDDESESEQCTSVSMFARRTSMPVKPKSSKTCAVPKASPALSSVASLCSEAASSPDGHTSPNCLMYQHLTRAPN